jgi:hypothetical protein
MGVCSEYVRVNETEQLIGIGEFSRRSWLSPKALRLYERLGLLVPAYVGEDNGYRHYRETQLEAARGTTSSVGRLPSGSSRGTSPSSCPEKKGATRCTRCKNEKCLSRSCSPSNGT